MSALHNVYSLLCVWIYEALINVVADQSQNVDIWGNQNKQNLIVLSRFHFESFMFRLYNVRRLLHDTFLMSFAPFSN